MTTELDFLFTDEQELPALLAARHADHALRARIEATLPAEARPVFDRLRQPRAVMFRQIASPNRETLFFLDRAVCIGSAPLILEYAADRFVSAHNWYKRTLGKLPVLRGRGTDGRPILHNRTVVDFNAAAGRPFHDIAVRSGTPLIQFHHCLLDFAAPYFDQSDGLVDASAWFAAAGGSAHNYYEQFLSLFITHAVLLEDFTLMPSERAMTLGTVIPAFEAVTHRFGVRPIIVRLVPEAVAAADDWYYYDPALDPLITQGL